MSTAPRSARAVTTPSPNVDTIDPGNAGADPQINARPFFDYTAEDAGGYRFIEVAVSTGPSACLGRLV